MATRDREKHPIPRDVVDGIVAGYGMEVEGKSAVIMVGRPKGPRVAIARSARVGQAYVYFTQGIVHPAVRLVSDKEREFLRYGNIHHEVDFTVSPEASVAGLRACLEAVRADIARLDAARGLPAPAAPPGGADFAALAAGADVLGEGQ